MVALTTTPSAAVNEHGNHSAWLGYALLGVTFTFALASLAIARLISKFQRR